MPNKLHFYTKYSKEKIKISDKPFASGGEGAIYAIASPRSYNHLVAKIYYPEKRTPEREAKMQFLMQHPPITFHKGQPPSIGWVQDLVYKDKRFIGILLIKIEGKKLTKLTLFKLPRRADKAWQRFSFKQPDAFKLRLRTCFNLAVVIHQIHEGGQYVLVDLKPDNILMQPNGILAVVDMDSVEVLKDGVAIFSAPVATPEYTPPEHYLGPRGTIEETWDHFSLGVIFYQLLLGLHPFAASGNPPYDNLVSIHDKIKNDLYVHHSENQAFLKVIPPPHQQFYKIPVEIQELFQNCFEHGAKEPDLRPSPADWCNTLADLLKLPFKKIPKLKTPPSNLYFSPKVLVEAFDFTVPTLSNNHSFLNFNLEELAPSTPTSKKEDLVHQLKVAYKKQIQGHRKHLIQSTLAGIFLISLLFTFPVLFVLLALLLSIIAPQLFFNKFQTNIDNIGKAILSKSSYKLLQLNEKNTLKKENLNSSNKLIHTLLSEKENALSDKKKQLRTIKTDPIELNFIQEYLKKRAVLEEKITALNHWIKNLELEVLATREAELDQYKIANKDFLKKLNDDPIYEVYDFKSFRNLRIKIQQTINALEGSLALNSKSIEQLHLNQQKKLDKLKNTDHTTAVKSYHQKLEFKAKKELKELFETKNKAFDEHKEAYWSFTQKKKRLKKNNHQRQQKVDHQLNKSLQRMGKDLGLNSKSELSFYMDFFDHSQKEFQLDFAPKQTRKQFDLFLQKIKAINLNPTISIDPVFSAEIIKILTSRLLPSANFDTPQKAKNIRTLSDLQQKMTTSWAVNKTKLDAFEKALDKLIKSPGKSKDPIELAYWAKTGQEQLSNIFFNLNIYTESQSKFYGDPVIFRLRNKLKEHKEKAQDMAQKIKELKEELLNKLQHLEEKNSTLIGKQKKIDDLEKEQEQLIVEQEKALTESVDKQTALYLDSLNEQQVKLIETTTKEHQEELELLEQQINDKQASLSTKLKKAEQALEKLTLSRASFETTTNTIRSNTELFYTNKRLLTNQRCQETSDLAHTIQEEHPKALQVIKKNAIAYKSLNARVLEYKDNLNELNQLQEERIRLDTLTEWKQSYESRIYIKDLLLNKVEQFEKYE